MKSTPQIIRFCKSEEEIEFERILAHGLPSHGSARREARSTVSMYGVSLTLVCKLISDATRKPVNMKQITSALRRKGVPFIKIDFDDPLIWEPDAADIRQMNLPGLAGKAVDYYDLARYFPEVLHGAVDGDVFMPPRGMEILEDIPAYTGVKGSRDWEYWKRRATSQG